MSEQNSPDEPKEYQPYEEYKKQTSGVLNSPDPSNPKTPPNALCTIAFFLSLASIICCCLNLYISIAGCIFSIALAICSKFYNNEAKKMHGLAIAAIVISSIVLILLIIMIIFSIVIFPDLMEKNPELKSQFNRIINEIYGTTAAE